jgi:hypothetical protein
MTASASALATALRAAGATGQASVRRGLTRAGGLGGGDTRGLGSLKVSQILLTNLKYPDPPRADREGGAATLQIST